jgi:hypothetical protein
MPFSEQEKINLANNGKWMPEQIEFFENAQVSYDNIKRLQSLFERALPFLGRQNPTLETINETICRTLEPIKDPVTGIISESKLNKSINQVEYQIRPTRGGFGRRRSRKRSRRRSRRRSGKRRGRRSGKRRKTLSRKH